MSSVIIVYRLFIISVKTIVRLSLQKTLNFRPTSICKVALKSKSLCNKFLILFIILRSGRFLQITNIYDSHIHIFRYTGYDREKAQCDDRIILYIIICLLRFISYLCVAVRCYILRKDHESAYFIIVFLIILYIVIVSFLQLFCTIEFIVF